ncbi:MAG: hypothetical protein GX643_16350 [Acidimicrobiales bacterium]|nr:hypothetical protein [Acidimicrobiales bacterium]
MTARTRTTSRPRLLAVSLLAALTVSGGAAACGVTVGDDVATVSGPTGTSGTDATSSTTSTVVLAEGSFEGTGGAVFLRDAAAATAEVTSQRMAMTMTVAGLPGVDGVSMTYEGAFDNETLRGHIVVDMSDFLGGFGGEDLGSMEMVIDGDTIYVRSELFSSLAGGKPWVRMSEDGLADASGGVGIQGDPTRFLDFLEGVSDDLEEIGREDQRGVSTTHVRADIDVAKLMDDSSSQERAELEESLEELGGLGGVFESIPVDVWVDDDGYVRRLTMTFDVGAGLSSDENSSGSAVTMDMELYDFNEPIEVPVPDPSEVGELESFFGSGFESGD